MGEVIEGAETLFHYLVYFIFVKDVSLQHILEQLATIAKVLNYK